MLSRLVKTGLDTEAAREEVGNESLAKIGPRIAVVGERAVEEADGDLPGHRTDTGVVELLADSDRLDGWFLTLDRIAQSYVDLQDPSYLEFDYVQGFADLVDSAFPPEGRLDVVHVGGGALTFPRYVVHTRPGSTQIVFEPDAALTALVRHLLPLPSGSEIDVRTERGRGGIASLSDACADLIVLDAFAGGRVPAELTTVEAITDVARVLRPGGLFVANVADGAPLGYTARLVAGVRRVFDQALIRSDPAVRKRRFGNVVVAASSSELPTSEVVRRAHAAYLPIAVVAGDELDRLVGAAKPWTDADSSRSPSAPESAWRIGGGQ